jgi:hypothetical protein
MKKVTLLTDPADLAAEKEILQPLRLSQSRWWWTNWTKSTDEWI